MDTITVPSCLIMIPDQKFQQRWEYRKKDDDVDSSSDDCKSNSDYDPVQKKHKVLSDLVLYQKDEESDTPRSQHSNQINVTTDIPLQIAEASNMHFGSGKENIAAVKRSEGNSGKKRKRKRKVKHTKEPAQMADLKTFTESLLKELKVAKDTMFIRMKKQMTRLMSVKSALRTKRRERKTDKAIHQNEKGSGKKTQKCQRSSIKRPTKSSKASGSSKRVKAIENETNHEQAPMANEMEKRENLSLPVKKPINGSDHTASSSYLTLPSILSKPQTDSLRIESSSCDNVHAGCATNRTNILERANFLTDTQSHHGYLSSILPDEQFGSFSQMNSTKSMGFFDHQSNATLSVSPGLQVPLHQWPNKCFSITSQIVLETQGQENTSVGLKMNTGGIRFPGRSHAISESFIPNTVTCNMKNNTDAGLVPFRSVDIKPDHIFPK